MSVSQSGALTALDMRAPLVIFITFLHSLVLTRTAESCSDPVKEVEHAKAVANSEKSSFRMKCEDGYVRKAGTSNLFKCSGNKWKNEPKLECIPDPAAPASKPKATSPAVPTAPTVHTTAVLTSDPQTTTSTASSMQTEASGTSGTSATPFCTTSTSVEPQKSTSTVSTTHIASTTQTFHQSSPEATTSNKSPIISEISAEKIGISVGIIILIIVGLAATSAFILWRQRSGRSMQQPPKMEPPNPETGLPLLAASNNTSSFQESEVRHSDVPPTDTAEPCRSS